MTKNEKFNALPDGGKYFQVQEQVWIRTGADDADDDYNDIAEFCATLEEAIAAARTYKGRNRVYIDVMTKVVNPTNGLTAAFGSPVFAGYISNLNLNTLSGDWRFQGDDLAALHQIGR